MAQTMSLGSGNDAFIPDKSVIGGLRRLTAILSADLKDSCLLMGLDEEATFERMRRYRHHIIDPAIAQHQGRVVRNTGDGFLAIFNRPCEAVRCAIAIQENLVVRNVSLPKKQKMQYRIGVNFGDVIVDADDIYGDGVNVAARVQSVAEPDTVYISGGVYEQIKNKLVCGFHSLGDHRLKNITEPVRIYRVLPDPEAVAQATQRAPNRAGASHPRCCRSGWLVRPAEQQPDAGREPTRSRRPRPSYLSNECSAARKPAGMIAWHAMSDSGTADCDRAAPLLRRNVT